MNPYIITVIFISQQNYISSQGKTPEIIKPISQHKAVLSPIRELSTAKKN
jgi:hypothetical protein